MWRVRVWRVFHFVKGGEVVSFYCFVDGMFVFLNKRFAQLF